MGWEFRGSRRYFYRTIRVPGVRNPVKQYLGHGGSAEIAACLHAERLVKSQAERQALRAANTEIEEPSWALHELDRAARMLTEAVLLASGFYQHHRGWRRHGTLNRESG